jgi:predicted AlkP superfamily pyrophosphatase or phosphodiesterase
MSAMLQSPSPRRPAGRARLAFVVALVFALAALAVFSPAGVAPLTAAERLSGHVVLITIDGFRPAVYLDSEREGVKVPTLTALRTAGSAADGVIVAYPSMTYPSHTSLATGVAPAKHGIVSNTIFDPANGSRLWYYENAAVKVPAIWDVALKNGRTTAGVSWPVTVGAKMTVIYPESNQLPSSGTWLAGARRDSTPGLVDAVVNDLGGFGEKDNLDPVKRDRFAAATAIRIIKTTKPDLLMMHLMETDSAQHANGPGSPQARAAYERVDAHIGAILAALDEAGIREQTTVIITGDHGFGRIHSLFQPNVVLRQAGLLKADDKGAITEWQAVTHGTAIRLKNPKDPKLAARVTKLFEDLSNGPYRGLFRVVKRDELTARGAYPEALLFLEPAEGYYLSDGFDDDAFLVGTTRRGAHGYLPTEPRMFTGFIASGAGVRRGVPLPSIRQIDIAPTIARLLGFDMPNVDGTPIVGILATPK